MELFRELGSLIYKRGENLLKFGNLFESFRILYMRGENLLKFMELFRELGRLIYGEGEK